MTDTLRLISSRNFRAMLDVSRSTFKRLRAEDPSFPEGLRLTAEGEYRYYAHHVEAYLAQKRQQQRERQERPLAARAKAQAIIRRHRGGRS